MVDNVRVWSLEGRSRVDRKMGLILKPEDTMGELELWTEGWVLGSLCGAGERLSIVVSMTGGTRGQVSGS